MVLRDGFAPGGGSATRGGDARRRAGLVAADGRGCTASPAICSGDGTAADSMVEAGGGGGSASSRATAGADGAPDAVAAPDSVAGAVTATAGSGATPDGWVASSSAPDGHAPTTSAVATSAAASSTARRETCDRRAGALASAVPAAGCRTSTTAVVWTDASPTSGPCPVRSGSDADTSTDA